MSRIDSATETRIQLLYLGGTAQRAIAEQVGVSISAVKRVARDTRARSLVYGAQDTRQVQASLVSARLRALQGLSMAVLDDVCSQLSETTHATSDELSPVVDDLAYVFGEAIEVIRNEWVDAIRIAQIVAAGGDVPEVKP